MPAGALLAGSHTQVVMTKQGCKSYDELLTIQE